MAPTMPSSRCRCSGVRRHVFPTAPGVAAPHRCGSSLPLAPCTQIHRGGAAAAKQGGSRLGRRIQNSLAETDGASRHDESEVSKDSPLRVLRGFLASPGSTKWRVLGHRDMIELFPPTAVRAAGSAKAALTSQLPITATTVAKPHYPPARSHD